jgi:hypothetical protein
MTEKQPNKCEDCRHAYRFHDPNNVTAEMYQCRESPPLMMAVPQRGGMGMMVTYPNIMAGFVGCSKFVQRLPVLVS